MIAYIKIYNVTCKSSMLINKMQLNLFVNSAQSVLCFAAVMLLSITAQWGAHTAVIYGPINQDADVERNVTLLITSKGYSCEDYSVLTEDGFILSLQRIPYSRSYRTNEAIRPVVFLQHGLLDSSATWVINLPHQSLGFMLADAGFDVWMGNMRGNTYSKRHTYYSPIDKEFWDWSWDEMAHFDLPAMLEFVLKTTGQPDLFYVGHSQGAMTAFAKLSKDQQFAKKIRAFFGLAPVVTLGHIKGALPLLADITSELQLLFELLGVRDFLPSNELMKFFAKHLCNNFVTREVCKDFIFLIAGFDHAQLNSSRLPVYFAHTPAGTSVRNIVHFAQMVKSAQFQMYDFGSAHKNMQHYNQSTPPLYNISAVNVPTYIFSGENDYLADAQDIALLLSSLSCVKGHTIIEKWEHLDFIWGLNANQLLYTKLIDIMRHSVDKNSGLGFL